MNKNTNISSASLPNNICRAGSCCSCGCLSQSCCTGQCFHLYRYKTCLQAEHGRRIVRSLCKSRGRIYCSKRPCHKLSIRSAELSNKNTLVNINVPIHISLLYTIYYIYTNGSDIMCLAKLT